MSLILTLDGYYKDDEIRKTKFTVATTFVVPVTVFIPHNCNARVEFHDARFHSYRLQLYVKRARAALAYV